MLVVYFPLVIMYLSMGLVVGTSEQVLKLLPRQKHC